MMGPRSGSIASGILVYPLRQNGLDAGQLDQALNLAWGACGSDLGAGLRVLGLPGPALDRPANVVCQPDADVAVPASTGRILVIATREDMTIVHETQRVLSRS